MLLTSVNPRRIRAILVMMAVWGVCAAIAGAVFGSASWFLYGRHQNVLFFDFLPIYAMSFAIVGIFAGAGFSFLLSFRGSDRGVESLQGRAGIGRWIVLSSISGALGYVFWLVATNQWGRLHHPFPQMETIITILKAGAIFGVIGGGIGTGIIAVARRGKALGTVAAAASELPEHTQRTLGE